MPQIPKISQSISQFGRKAGQGAKTLQDRIDYLRNIVGISGQKEAQELVDGMDGNILKLAYLMLPRQQGSTSIGKRNAALADVLPEDEAEQLRKLLQKAKALSKTA